MGVMYKGVAGLPTFGGRIEKKKKKKKKKKNMIKLWAVGGPPRLCVAPPVVMYGEWGTELPIIFRNLLVQSDYTV
jgi:hypothetical protein